MSNCHLKSTGARALVLMAAAVWAMPMPAQQPNLRSITRYRVKPDRVGDFAAAIKEFNAVLKKGGSDKPYTIWISQSGPREYLQIRYYTKWAELDFTRDPKMKEQAA